MINGEDIALRVVNFVAGAVWTLSNRPGRYWRRVLAMNANELLAVELPRP